MTIDQQMPQVLRIFTAALSQGWSLMQIFQHIQAQTTPPLSKVLQGFLDTVAQGTAFPIALQQMAASSESNSNKRRCRWNLLHQMALSLGCSSNTRWGTCCWRRGNCAQQCPSA